MCPQSELSSRQTVSVEIAMALEDTRRQKEVLQLQVWRCMIHIYSHSIHFYCTL